MLDIVKCLVLLLSGEISEVRIHYMMTQEI